MKIGKKSNLLFVKKQSSGIIKYSVVRKCIMRSKKNVIISIIVIVLLTVIVILTISVNKERKESKNNMEIIRKNYNLLTTSINKYNEIRNKYNDLSSVLIMDSYKDKEKELSELFNNYTAEIKNIDNYINNISLRCNGLYNDNEINKVCNSYALVYEKVINLYASDVDNYNEFINEYNEYKNDNIITIEKIHDYIDYNKDGKYEGRDVNEKN